MPLVAEARKSLEHDVRFESLRIGTTPAAGPGNDWTRDDFLAVARAMDGMASRHGAEFIGGLCGSTVRDAAASVLAEAFAEALASTERVCGYLNVAQTGAGLDLDGLRASVRVLRALDKRETQADRLDAFARFAVTANVVPNSPFMPMAYKSLDGPACSLAIGVGCIDRLIASMKTDLPIDAAADHLRETIRFEAERADRVAGALEEQTGLPVDTIDFSLVARPAGSATSVSHLLERLGAHVTSTGSLAVLSILNS